MSQKINKKLKNNQNDAKQIENVLKLAAFITRQHHKWNDRNKRRGKKQTNLLSQMKKFDWVWSDMRE